jgi:hypothetical protein
LKSIDFLFEVHQFLLVFLYQTERALSETTNILPCLHFKPRKGKKKKLNALNTGFFSSFSKFPMPHQICCARSRSRLKMVGSLKQISTEPYKNERLNRVSCQRHILLSFAVIPSRERGMHLGCHVSRQITAKEHQLRVAQDQKAFKKFYTPELTALGSTFFIGLFIFFDCIFYVVIEDINLNTLKTLQAPS